MVTVHLPCQAQSHSEYQFLFATSYSYQWEFPLFPPLLVQYQPFINNIGKLSIFKTSKLNLNNFISRRILKCKQLLESEGEH